MKSIQTPFFLKKLRLENNIFYAPLAGCSDYPFRKMNAQFKPGLMFCEMVKMEALIRRSEETLRMLDYCEEMRPIGAQVCGSSLELAGEAARIIEDRGFDVIDLNCGCPVDKVTKDGSGSGLLKMPEKIGEILHAMSSAVQIPVMVKIRLGWDEGHLVAPLITEIAEAAGASAITIHGRTRSQAYRGPARWEPIAECKRRAKTILVIGNGDINCPQDALRMFEQTGCDGVLMARGLFGQPWICQDIISLCKGEQLPFRTLEESRQYLLKHLGYSLAYKSEKGALIDMRRVCCWYLKNVAGAREFRAKASHAGSIEEVKSLIESFELKQSYERPNESSSECAAACDF